MPRLFGTDGIRGEANVDLRPSLAFGLGRAVVARMGRMGGLLVGQDTRRSGDMFVASIVAGAASMGADVYRLGVCPTPALAHLTGEGPFAAGIMVSASHNPATDNGLKVLGGDGLKIDESLEDELEQLLMRYDELVLPPHHGIGREVDAGSWLGKYMDHRLALAARTRCDLRLVLDCANGSAGVAAPQVLAATGAQVDVRFNKPDGDNINLDCGATSPEAAAKIVAETGADLGVCLDGDGDRCVAIDERGQVVDGDQLIGILALDRLARGALRRGLVVVSVLSNGGLEASIHSAGGRVSRTPVGDKYIWEQMHVAGAFLGGEKSGHVIIRDQASTGDGIVTALELINIIARTGRRLSDLASDITLYPQQQRTIPVRHKELWEAEPEFADAVATAQQEIDGHGRVLVRPSGTESALRIMVEGEDESAVTTIADRLADLAAERLN